MSATGAAEQLRAILGVDGVLDRAPDMAPFLTDWRGRFTGKALAVVRPRSTRQVAQVVGWCADRGVPVVPQGGNTGLSGGATPDTLGGSIVLSTRLLDKIRGVDAINDTITVEAGCVLQAVQEAARERARLFPLSLAAQGSCTIGGNLATNAGGVHVLRYGNARELTLGVEAVLADGSIWDGLRGLRKDNSGYDLKQLFIGSEGTLGVITAATLRLFPLPRTQVVCLLAAADLAAAMRLLERARGAAGAALTAFEVISADCVDLVARMLPGQRAPFAQSHPWTVLLEWSDQEEEAHASARCEDLCMAAIEGGDALDAVISRSLSDAAAFWRLRESIPEAQARNGGNVKHDISLPLETMAAFVEEAQRGLQGLREGLQAFVFGHLGDGNLHFNVGARAGLPASVAFDQEESINRVVFDAVLRHGGSISAEHGIGQLRRDLAQRVKPPVDRALMQALKHALDPKGLMNPGKVI